MELRHLVASFTLLGLAHGVAMADPSGQVRCEGEPHPPVTGFRHLKNRVIGAFGDPQHRGVDLIASADDQYQVIAGGIAYTDADKSLEDEDVDLYGCNGGAWRWLGMARTDDNGRFALTLALGDRLAIGLRDLYVSVAGNRSGARFTAYVAPAGSRVVVADIDGTLTSSENAFPVAVFFGGDVAANPGSVRTLQYLASSGYQIIYLTARADRFVEATRAWLDRQGFPPGPLRLARALVTMPGDATIAYKTGVLQRLAARFEISAGFGNRSSDVIAYTAVGVAPAHIFIKATEFSDELAATLASNAAIGFASYETFRIPQLATMR